MMHGMKMNKAEENLRAAINLLLSTLQNSYFKKSRSLLRDLLPDSYQHRNVNYESFAS
jgi:hypothetical protein